MKSILYPLILTALFTAGCQSERPADETSPESENDLQASPRPYDKLQDLSWLIGTWEDTDEDTSVERKAAWDDSKNFINEQFAITTLKKKILHGQQIIGWDPVRKEIRSWIFDSDGGFGEAIWQKEGENWNVSTTYTLADGRKASSVYIYSDITPASYTWQSTGRIVEGELLPNIEPVKVVKKAL